ncbi:MAG: hypothetical protein AB9866_16380 [Syntrophobacteraceae bacterium]
MTREEALQNLNLASDANPEDIEKAYQRLVRRYPPEFNPDKFRIVDDSYRQLTSLPAMIEKLLAPSVSETNFDGALLAFNPAIAASTLDEALKEISRMALLEVLWKPAETAQTGKSGQKKVR